MNAKEIALHFYETMELRFTPSTLAITIKQIKSLLESGYTSEEIVKVIDHYKSYPPPKGLYSFGYINVTINKALQDITVREMKEQAKRTTHIELPKQYTDAGTNNNKKKMTDNRFGSKYDMSIFEK
jgi:DNA-binding transcriptional MerR regulator